jgi:hypothetical protein
MHGPLNVKKDPQLFPLFNWHYEYDNNSSLEDVRFCKKNLAHCLLQNEG